MNELRCLQIKSWRTHETFAICRMLLILAISQNVQARAPMYHQLSIDAVVAMFGTDEDKIAAELKRAQSFDRLNDRELGNQLNKQPSPGFCFL